MTIMSDAYESASSSRAYHAELLIRSWASSNATAEGYITGERAAQKFQAAARHHRIPEPCAPIYSFLWSNRFSAAQLQVCE